MDDDPLSELTDRLVSPAEMAEIMGVSERDVRAWISDGQLPAEPDEHGEPRLRVSESWHEETDGAASMGVGFTSYQSQVDPERVVAARRAASEDSRERELAALDSAGVDIDALTAALARRLTAVAPREFTVDVDRRGDIGFLDVALTVSHEPETPAAQRIRRTAEYALERAQEHFAEWTTDPWPNDGPGGLPEPHADLVGEDRIRLYYGPAADPVLELEPLPLAEVLRG